MEEKLSSLQTIQTMIDHFSDDQRFDRDYLMKNSSSYRNFVKEIEKNLKENKEKPFEEKTIIQSKWRY